MNFPFGGEDGRGAVLDRNFTAIPCNQIDVVGHSQNLFFFEHAEHFIVCRHPGLFINELEHMSDRLVQSLIGRPSGENRGDRVQKRDSSLAVRGDNSLANAAQHSRPPLLSAGAAFRPVS